MAILLLEFLGDKAAQVPIQFFGTDVSETCITKARAGVYPENIQGDVSAGAAEAIFHARRRAAIASARAFATCASSRSTMF